MALTVQLLLTILKFKLILQILTYNLEIFRVVCIKLNSYILDAIFFTKLFFRSFTILKFKIFSSHMVGNCDVSKSQKKKLRKKFNVSSKLIHIQRLDCYAVFNAIHHSWREGEGVRIGFKLRGTWYKIPFVSAWQGSTVLENQILTKKTLLH